MNVKAERIEHVVQIINRNLSLVYTGQIDGITPLETKQLQRVDAVIFGHDKFAFEMVHFVKGAADKIKSESTNIADVWEANFVQGLETLLVECAVVSDDIERDCFVSRVYCWFTEKLAERRELPRRAPKADYLRSAVQRLEGDHTHTMRGLDKFDPENTFGASIRSQSEKILGPSQEPADEVKFSEDRDLPVIELPPARKDKHGNRKIPQYVKSGFPTVFETPEDANPGLFPKIPGAEENYGMVYNKPETEAERTMHELWMARRRQEAFEFKTQQHLSLVMDRLALHKSRLESDALRRQESGQMLKSRERPQSAEDPLSPRTDSRGASRGGGDVSSTVSATSPRSPRGGFTRTKVSSRGGTRGDASPQVKKNRMLRAVEAPPSPLRTRRHRNSPTRSSVGGDAPGESNLLHKASRVEGPGTHTAHKLEDRHLTHQDAKVTTIIVEEKGLATPTSIPRASRSSMTRGSKQGFLPMKFGTDLPDSYSRDRERFYMQLSDSDDDDKPERQPNPRRSGTGGGAGGGGGGGAGGNAGAKKKTSGGAGAGAAGKVEIKFKHERPVIRERPLSAKMFHNVSANDAELKVHYRHTNYRRMPMTERQEQWLEEQEQQRVKRSEETAAKIREAAAAKAEKKDKKADKNKGKDKDKKSKKDDKKGGKRPGSGAAGGTGLGGMPGEEGRPPPKYKSATQFMATHFPNFEGGEDEEEAMGPMRQLQLVEVSEIMEAFEDADVPIKEAALRKALVVPQDKPEALCLENLREATEGLMVNPLPKELWRKFTMSKKGKGGGGKKKGKKKK